MRLSVGLLYVSATGILNNSSEEKKHHPKYKGATNEKEPTNLGEKRHKSKKDLYKLEGYYLDKDKVRTLSTMLMALPYSTITCLSLDCLNLSFFPLSLSAFPAGICTFLGLSH